MTSQDSLEAMRDSVLKHYDPIIRNAESSMKDILQASKNSLPFFQEQLQIINESLQRLTTLVKAQSLVSILLTAVTLLCFWLYNRSGNRYFLWGTYSILFLMLFWNLFLRFVMF